MFFFRGTNKIVLFFLCGQFYEGYYEKFAQGLKFESENVTFCQMC